MIPTLPTHYLEQEIAHIEFILEKIKQGWLLPGVRLMKDPTGDVGKVFTFFPDEQKQVLELLDKLATDRIEELKKQQEKALS